MPLDSACSNNLEVLQFDLNNKYYIYFQHKRLVGPQII